jgi:hypothetical protein
VELRSRKLASLGKLASFSGCQHLHGLVMAAWDEGSVHIACGAGGRYIGPANLTHGKKHDEPVN